MKLRFRANTLRLRMNQKEVQALASGSVLQEQVDFPGSSRFVYKLAPGQESGADAVCEGSTIAVTVPASQITEWAASDSIGLYCDITAGQKTLRLMIEKDLECIDGPPEERDPDAFTRSVPKSC